jgi:cell division protein FtsI (penicillin-binding protein 3)
MLGFMGADGEPLQGFELIFNDMLSGKDGSETYETGGGLRLPLGENSVVEPVDGSDLALTIDRDVQWYTQRVLREAVEGSKAESGSAVVLDTRTAETLALADYPTFDANEPMLSPGRDLGMRSLFDVYEPGSVQKVLTAASLVDARKVSPDTRITVPPRLQRQDRVIGDYWDHGRLRLTLTGVIAKSSNIGTVLAADEFSPKELYDYLSRFGLGEKTGVGVPGESRGLLPFWESWSQINQDTISFGQGVSVNALQMAAAVNAIANGGVLVEPSLVKGEATTSQGVQVGSDTRTSRRVVSERAARLTAEMMEAVTDPEEGTAPAAAIEGYRVAGKTGTAQRVGEDCRCYDGTFTVSFAGFAPADDPRFLVYVVVQDPKNGGGGGSIGGPAFHKIMSYLLRKYAVPPTGAPAPDNPVEW